MTRLKLTNIPASKLPAEWTRRLGIASDALVDVTIESQAARRERAEGVVQPFDREAVERILDQVAALPVRDERSPDEILGYDAHGLPR